MNAISYGGPLKHAWTRMQLVLFAPFDVGKWLVMGFTAWLASLSEGGTSGGNLGLDFDRDIKDRDWGDWATGTAERVRDFIESGLEFFLVMVLVIAGLLIVLLLIWLSARGTFMFLDNVVHRLGFAASRRAARQLVRHRHVEVNGRTVDIPSYVVRPNDEVKVKGDSKDMVSVRGSLEALSRAAPVSWLSVDAEKAVGKLTELPTRDQIPIAAQEQLIVELYSK